MMKPHHKQPFIIPIRCLLICLAFISGSVFALANNTFENNVSKPQDLEWGTVLFDYYQQDYFNALIAYDYIYGISNPQAHSKSGKLLQGAMLLSYGMADESHAIFQSLLDDDTDTPVRNGAWFYLANLFYHKSQHAKARDALQQIRGDMPPALHTQYHYLASLLNADGKHLPREEKTTHRLPGDNPHYAYMLFNYAINQLHSAKIHAAVTGLTRVTQLAANQPALAALGDRARHGLAQLALQHNDLHSAWQHLQGIRTSGLYSNRGLLSYAWTAIKLEQFNDAIVALQTLNTRSIAIAEVQEAKMLLAHLYEQQGQPHKALKSYLLAIDAFTRGLSDVAEARRIISLQDVPKEFIVNFNTIVGISDWYAVEPSVDYQKLTPFVLDLIASHAFTETLKELSDLYSIQKNLQYWALQSQEHQLILDTAAKKQQLGEQSALIEQSHQLKRQLEQQKSDLALFTLALEESEQQKLTALVQSIDSELTLLNSRVRQLKKTSEPYKQPVQYKQLLTEHRRQIAHKLNQTRHYIRTLEPVMRNLVNAQLSRHEERMQYYLAQSRLAKARLYDTTLMTSDKASSDKEPL